MKFRTNNQKNYLNVFVRIIHKCTKHKQPAEITIKEERLAEYNIYIYVYIHIVDWM